MSVAFSDRYKTPLRFALAQMLALTLFSTMALDFGAAAIVCFRALIVFAAMLLLILLRRPSAPTRFDLLVLKWGFPALYLACFVVYTPLLRSRGFL